MKRMIALLIVGLLLSLTAASCVSATDKEKNPIINHGSIYVGSKPLHRYNDPGFVFGWYDTIEWSSTTSVRYLYSPHLLFGWDIDIVPEPSYFKYSFQVAAFASRVLFTNFGHTFIGYFSGTEPGFIFGFVDDTCTFYYREPSA